MGFLIFRKKDPVFFLGKVDQVHCDVARQRHVWMRWLPTSTSASGSSTMQRLGFQNIKVRGLGFRVYGFGVYGFRVYGFRV